MGRTYLECNQDLPCLNFWYGSPRNSIVFECSYDGSYTNNLIDLENGRIWGIVGTDEEPEIMKEGSDENVSDNYWSLEGVVYDQEEEEYIYEGAFEIMEKNDEETPNWDNYLDFYWR